MCGITGWALKPGFELGPERTKVLMSFLMNFMDARGGDSYGIAKLNEEGKLAVWRGLHTAAGNLKLPAISRARQLMLHTRKKTHGAISLENAHPVLQGHILGCHNGVISNHSALNSKYGRDFELDSRHIFQHINDGEDVSDIDVYGAISYMDMNDLSRIYLCKLSISGDLEIYGIGPSKEACQGIVYASTSAAITTALRTLRLPYFSYRVTPKELFYIQNGVLMTTNQILPFGAKPYTTTNTGAYSSQDRRWSSKSYEPDPRFKPCKGCKKVIKRRGGNMSPIDLCTSCWRDYNKYQVFGTNAVVTGPYYCSADKCYEKGSIKINDQLFCDKCFNIQSDTGGEKGVVDAPFCSDCAYCHAVGEGACNSSTQEAGPERLEAMDDRLGTYMALLPPAEDVDIWELCHACSQHMQLMGYKKKIIQEDWCRECKALWDSMITALTNVPKEQRSAYNPVTWCTSCGSLPIFGSRKDDGSKSLTCTPCRNKEAAGLAAQTAIERAKIVEEERTEEREYRIADQPCIICKHDSQFAYSTPTAGGFVHYCRHCFNTLGAVGRRVAEMRYKELRDATI